MIVVFPTSADSRSLPDSKFLKESMACEELGLEYVTVNLRALMAGDLQQALQHTRAQSDAHAIYRGGTLRPAEYHSLYDGLAKRGIHMRTSPVQFRATQLFPEFFPRIADLSLPAVTTTSYEATQAAELAHLLGPGPYFFKDFVKSAKEIWPQGCVVPSPGTAKQFAQVIGELREFRADRLESGLVIRPLVPLKSLGNDPFGDPTFEEYRMIFINGRRAFTEPYGFPRESTADFTKFDALGQRFDSPFFMADSVVTSNGEHLVLETGDGGCCGLPPSVNLAAFYRLLSGELG